MARALNKVAALAVKAAETQAKKNAAHEHETIRRQALSLPPEQRAQLAKQLLSSLDELSETEIEQLWYQEATRRAAEMDQGSVERILAETVLREVQGP